jgi:hypothetical protein
LYHPMVLAKANSVGRERKEDKKKNNGKSFVA